MDFDLSCAFATSLQTPDHVAIAESLGYKRAWLYDSPALYPDVWATLVRCAERTSTIGLGPGVLIPSLRHPMVNAAAIAMLAEIAGVERVAVAVGSGFTGRYTLGQRPLKWADVVLYVQALKGLLRGEIVEWEGAKMQMMHPDGYGTPRPIKVPFLLGAGGPKGIAAARAEADGVFMAGGGGGAEGFAWQSQLLFGSVIDDDADLADERVVAAAGPGVVVAFHAWYERGMPMAQLPSGAEWEAAYADLPADERHLAVHDRHLIAVNDRDRPFVTPAVLRGLGAVYTPAELRGRLAAMAANGMTEIAYQPSGPDIPGELERFAAAVRG